MKSAWEERFESRYGRWRDLVDGVVCAFTDCGDLSRGFARVDCDACGREFLLFFSLDRRGLLGSLCRAAWKTVAELVAEAAGEDVRPGMVATLHSASADPRGGIRTCTP